MKKNLLVLSACILALLGFVVSEGYQRVGLSSANSFDLKITAKQYLLQTLSSELEDINVRLPRQIDEHTSLTSVAIEGDMIVNSYTIKSTSLIVLTPEFIVSNLIPQLVYEVCNDQTKREFLENDVAFSMDYYDSDQMLIFKALITRAECK